LIGTAHGQTIDNLLLNPTLSDLIGGIEAVTLSDEEARRRGTQKRCSNGAPRPPLTCWSRSRRVTVSPSTWTLPPRSIRSCAATAPAGDSFARCAGQDPDREGQSQPESQTGFGISHRNRQYTGAAGRTAHRLPNPAQSRQPVRPAGGVQSAHRIPPHSVQSVRVYPYGVGARPPDPGRQAPGRAGHDRKDAGEADVMVTLRSITVIASRPSCKPSTAACRSLCCAPYCQPDGTVPERSLQPIGAATSRGGNGPDQAAGAAAIAAVLNGERWVDLPPARPPSGGSSTSWPGCRADLAFLRQRARRHVRIFRE